MTTNSTEQELDRLYEKALKKIGAKDENNICHYLPGPSGGYIHHFTLRKMRQQNPTYVAELINKHIIEAAHPKALSPKPRAPRGSRKRKDVIQLNATAIERLLNLARASKDHEAIAILTPRRSPAACRRELIASIRSGRVDHELWNAYASAMSSQEMTTLQAV